MYRQCELEMVTQPKDFDGGDMLCKRRSVFRLCWINIPSNAKVGSIISLAGWDHFFVINKIYDPAIERAEIKHGWKVGGLK